MAEAIFNHKIREKGLSERFIADSAGTANYHVGEKPDPRTIETVEKNMISIDHRGQQFKKKHSKEFDYLIAMDESNRTNMRTEIENPDIHVLLMRDFDSLGKGQDVPDPWFGGMKGFDDVYDILDRSIDQFITYLQEQEQS